MPELPEVETVARQLAPLIEGRAVRSLRIVDDELLTVERPGRLRGARIETVRRLGKQVLLELTRRSGPLFVAVHLRMTGRLVWRAGGRFARAPHLRAALVTDGGVVDFVDVRRFGTIKLTDELGPLEPLGVDPLTRAFSRRELERLIGESKQAIKAWLLRQDRIVGLGNIYACEILYRIGVDPTREAGSLTPEELDLLHPTTKSVLRMAIKACGTTFSDFQDAYGLTGSFQRYLKVYAREDEPCERCGGLVERIVQQQRSTFWCPGCQT